MFEHSRKLEIESKIRKENKLTKEIKNMSPYESKIASKIKDHILDLRIGGDFEFLFFVMFWVGIVSYVFCTSISSIPVKFIVIGVCILHIFLNKLLLKIKMKNMYTSLSSQEIVVAKKIFPEDFNWLYVGNLIRIQKSSKC